MRLPPSIMPPATSARLSDPTHRTRSTVTFERVVLGIGSLVPLAIIGLLAVTLSSFGAAAAGDASAEAQVIARRPAATAPQPPPTLVPPTLTPVPQPASAAAQSPDQDQEAGRYTVQRGDELRHIAADHHVTIKAVLDVNDIADPDNLRVGQVLRIPKP
jgi:nucleoid-associated protein YgaU